MPFVPAKGEILTIHSKELKSDKILMKEIFVLPLGNHNFKVGSTYDWDKLDENPSEEGRKELVSKLDNLLDCSYTITGHCAGIRPAVKDRKPVMGLHPNYKIIGIFNGLGTKGATLAPYFAHQLWNF
ncbi:MAG: FAD-dependent oxidoreductase [Bacteroidales bacterium]|nr:FAD-dependent oxidoreductase [Bacteroidales bacterium]